MTVGYGCFGVIILTDGTRNPSVITQANLNDLVGAFDSTFTGGHLTWHLDDGALDDSTGSWGWLRTFVAGRVAAGDAVSYWRKFGGPGLSPAGERSVYDTYMPLVAALGGPALVSGWYIPIETLNYVSATYGVKTAVAQCWSQHAVDGFSLDGSPNCPYYPSKFHSLIPAQDMANATDVVLLDVLSQDLFAAASGSRVTMDPADAGTLTRMEQITASYFSDSWSPGPIRWINQHVQPDYLYTPANAADLTRLKDYWTWLRASYNVTPVNIDAFGTAWRAAHPTNDFAVAQGQIDPGGSGDAVYWLHKATHRAAVKRTNAGTFSLLDLVRYSDATVAPACPALNVEPPARVNERDTYHPANLYTVAAYRELVGLFGQFSALNGLIRT